MALFESYERREKQILAVLKEYGINSIEEAAEITKAAGLDVYAQVENGVEDLQQEGVFVIMGNNRIVAV